MRRSGYNSIREEDSNDSSSKEDDEEEARIIGSDKKPYKVL